MEDTLIKDEISLFTLYIQEFVSLELEGRHFYALQFYIMFLKNLVIATDKSITSS